MNNRRFEVSLGVSKLLPSAHVTDLSKDGKIFDSADDDGLPSSRQILASPKPLKQAVGVTCDDDDDNEDDKGDVVVALFPSKSYRSPD